MTKSATTRPEPHPYHGDGIKDHRDADRCVICHLPRRGDDDPMHTLEEVPQELAELKARILGEDPRTDNAREALR